MSTPTTETPETLRALARKIVVEAKTISEFNEANVESHELRARAAELERHIAEMEKDSAFRQRVETVGIVQASRELESAERKFKIGDRVRVKDDAGTSVAGKLATVHARGSDGIYLTFDDYEKGITRTRFDATELDSAGKREAAFPAPGSIEWDEYIEDRENNDGLEPELARAVRRIGEAAETDQLREALAALREAVPLASEHEDVTEEQERAWNAILARATGGKS